MASPQQPASPRHSRGFSFSGRSDKSSNSGSHKVRLSESAEEKHKRTLHTKADPMVAMSEAQPMLVALEKSTLGSLREMQHKDQYGNVITDPDLSNPTRPRLERPLDTIRSFEAAIYGTYNSRPVSYARTGHNGYSRGYNDQNGHYHGRGNYSRPESYMEGNYGGGPPPENYYPYNQQGGGRRPRPRHRMESEYHGGYAPNGYGSNGYHKSYENVTAASGSGSNTEPWTNSTDPSSVNSSIDQLQRQQQEQQQQQLQQQQQRQEKAVADRYGFSGFGPEPNLNNGGALASGAAGTGRINLNNSAPVTDPTAGGPVGGPPPTAGAPTARRHLRKATNASEASDTKRKSWFKRRFSKD
ncbi:uncharacterized protein BDW43DRAFT_303321 [Aspergillus alliaceus]|uniref:uncharacterized protein n=1 Tax=Petromyces alliaceus TaxID=209559 RepID=UPI0012A49E6E|nr:uncharacterized protein BDW43DRAFT_303321 [Aspergillus alliaceus]KAB8229204.1 hypothetical protein BDW43DRAFT_303321 [Aspergillus alliaceus]